MSDAIESYNLAGLKQLLKALKAKPPQCRVGILGNSASRDKEKDGGESKTNAEVGAGHEFGSRNHPKRSFLRMPIEEKLGGELYNAGLMDHDTLSEVIEGSVKPWLEKIGKLAEGVIDDAFHTGGFGKWPKWRTPGYTHKTGELLVNTEQLRESISSEVK